MGNYGSELKLAKICYGLDVVGGGVTSGCRCSEQLAQHYGVTKHRRKRRKIAAQGICVC
ncbi:DEAD-box ATP-dependent RNA helicase 20-like [Pyrus ussuriensis x Pyrus communis]|uniref:DEAD-box ATP-dependent RNA helicase 20-like n=1 Tax=Pyrus ussuriensis x Pyrus communis TaxID=2448454 RepID=A0A5N5GRS7_9ROSA|nr:DEAD-box ATP-dependent RNA helicase 20-like [Pyrus ussuriensis x Pyrus communis]